MKSLLLLLLLILISSGLGRVLLRRCTVLSSAPIERFAYGTALGLGIGALGVFALGMAGLLSFWPISAWWLLLAGIGLVGTIRNVGDALQWLVRGRPTRLFRLPNGDTDLTYVNLIAPLAVLVLTGTVLFCVCACFQPPAGHEWDALAYHLADPKVFLSQHRITVLPTEHHSNFPFLMEMLYCVGLLYDGYPLANLLHLTMGVLTLAAVFGFCRRVFPAQVGWIAVLLLATTPLYLWECCVAYIDAGLGLYVTLAAFAGTMLIEAAEPQPDAGSAEGAADRSRRLREWGLLAGAATGFALGIKYLALIPFAMLPLLLAYRRVPLRQILTVVGIAVLIGCPWYVKNVVMTHNPVYPYFYKLFPSSKYWSADRAAIYQSEQSGFGFSHALTPGVDAHGGPAGPGVTLANLMQAPWRLISVPRLFTNGGDYTFIALVGGLYAAGIFPLVYFRKIPRPIVNLLLLLGAQLLVWFFVGQVVRYLVYLLPLAAVCAAYGLYAVSSLDRKRGGTTARNLRLFPTLATLVLTWQVLFTIWAIFVLPTSSKVSTETGLMLTGLSLGDVLKNATEPDTHDDYLNRRLDVYAAMDWINRNTPPSEGVVLYDEPRGFYLDRPYIWGNREHSSYIPYDKMKDGIELTSWLRERGYRYVLINLHWSPNNRPGDPLVAGQELEQLRTWYVETPVPGQWRYLLADAMRRGLWTATTAHTHGVVVLEIVGGESGGGRVSLAGRNLP